MTIIQQIMNGDFDNNLTDMVEAIQERRKLTRFQNNFIAMVDIKIGDTVVLKGLKPSYVNGLKAKVIGKKRTKLSIEIISGQDTGRFGRFVTVPADCLEKV